MDVETFLDRRAAACAELAELEVEQGRCWLDDKPFDPALIDAKQAEIATLDRAEAEAIRRDRAAVAEAQAKDRAEARKEARTLAATQAAALTRVEESVKALAADLGVMNRSAASLSALFRRCGLRAPLSVERKTMFTAMSRLIANEFMGLDGRTYLGDLKWPSVEGKANWSAHAAAIANDLAPLVDGEDA